MIYTIRDKRPKRLQGRSSYFTLIELLVVIAIIGILASMLLPSLLRAKYVATMAIDISNHKQVALAATSYAGDNDEFYPTNKDINYHQSAFSVKNKTGSGDMAYDDVADLEPYYGEIGTMWACPLATVAVKTERGLPGHRKQLAIYQKSGIQCAELRRIYAFSWRSRLVVSSPDIRWWNGGKAR